MESPASLAHSASSPAVGSRAALSGVARILVPFSILALLAYYALFRLPFWFPPQHRLVSASYMFGFNNSVAIFAMTGLLAGITLLRLLSRRKAVGLPVAFVPQAAPVASRSTRIALLIAALGYGILTLVMYIYNSRSAPWLMWETRHLLYRTWLMDLYGLRPYLEIGAEYGPILTYAPSWMHWLLKPFNGSYEQAYFAAHFLLNAAGLWCAYYVLSRAIMPARFRTISLIILAIAGFVPCMGLNGVLVRYLFPFAGLLLGHRTLAWMLSRRSFVPSSIRGTMVVLLLLAGNILLSAEAGVAFALAWLGYAVIMLRSDVRIVVVSVIAFVTAGLLSWLFLPAAYYGTLFRFSEGANNLPLLPAPHLLLYLLTLFLLVPALLAATVRQWWAGDIVPAAICGALGLLCVVMSPGALGRCDPPHVLFFGMGAGMLLMILSARVSNRAFATYTVAYAGVFILFTQSVNLVVFYQISPKTLVSTNLVRNLVQKFRSASGTDHPNSATLSALDRYPRLGLPFATFGDPAVEKYVVTRGKLQPEYYVSIVGVYTSADLDRKLRDVGRMEYLLLPKSMISTAALRDPCADELERLRQWFLYPAKLACRAKPLDPRATVQSFIADHYTPVEQVGSWAVLRRFREASTPRLQ